MSHKNKKHNASSITTNIDVVEKQTQYTSDSDNKTSQKHAKQGNNNNANTLSYKAYMQQYTSFHKSQYGLLIGDLKKSVQESSISFSSIAISLIVITLLFLISFLLNDKTYYFTICVKLVPCLCIVLLVVLMHFLNSCIKNYADNQNSRKEKVFDDSQSLLNPMIALLCTFLKANAKSVIPEKLALVIDIVKQNATSKSEELLCFNTILSILKGDEVYDQKSSEYTNDYKVIFRKKCLTDKQKYKFVYLCGKMCDTGYVEGSNKRIVKKKELEELSKVIDLEEQIVLEFIDALVNGDEEKWYCKYVSDSSNPTNLEPIASNVNVRTIQKPTIAYLTALTLLISIYLALVTQYFVVVFVILCFIITLFPLYLNNENLQLEVEKLLVLGKVALIVYAVMLPFILICYMHEKAETIFYCNAMSEYIASPDNVNVCNNGHKHAFTPKEKSTCRFIENTYDVFVPKFFKKKQQIIF